MNRMLLIMLPVLMLWSASSTSAPPELSYELTPLKKPVPAPEFVLKDMDDAVYRLADYRGKVVLLNFWATWCPPCRREMPSMERLAQDMGADNFVVLAINQTEDPDHVFAFIGQLDVDPTFPIIFDTDSQIALKYQVQGLPTTYLIDKQGNIRFRAVGGREFDHPEVEKIIKALIAE